MKPNKQQLKVINFKKGACCVIAGAGSGKTFCIIQRIKKLVEEGVDPVTILAISFTNKSAANLKSKLKKEGLENVQVGTFHAVCKKILTNEGVDTSKQLPTYEIENIFKKIDKKAKCKEIMSFISYHKTSNVGVEDDFLIESKYYTEDEMREFYRAYEEHKKSKRALDFTDWMSMTIKILEKDKSKYTFDYLLIDEQQDNDILQNRLMELLCPKENIMVVGDFRQSIYGFKGASPELFMNFDKRFKDTKIINLDLNYRSCNNIVENSNKFIKSYFSNFRHYSDAVANDKRNGDIQLVTNITKEQEGSTIAEMIKKDLERGIKPKDIAVLYRNNSQSFYIENELKERNIEYHIESNNNFFERKEIKAVICMLRLLQNPGDNSAYDTIFRTRCNPFNFLSNKLLSDIEDRAAMKDISLLDASEGVRVEKRWQREALDKFIDIHRSLLIQYQKETSLLTIINNIIKLFRLEKFINEKYDGEELDERLESLIALRSFVRNNTLDSFLKFVYTSETSKKKIKDNEVQLMTIHKSKGLEFEKVYIIGVEDGKFPSQKARDINEEARLFYVGVTRSKKDQVISEIGDDNRFINEYFN